MKRAAVSLLSIRVPLTRSIRCGLIVPHTTTTTNLLTGSGTTRSYGTMNCSKSISSTTRLVEHPRIRTERVAKQQSPRWMSSSSSSSSSSVSGTEMEAALCKEMGEMEGRNVSGAMEALINADAVCFDVDSTVVTEEGIDVLADSLGKGPEVSAWTLQAMEGDTKFEDALEARLSIMEPSRDAVQACLQNHPLEFSPGLPELVRTLRSQNIDVYLVSGGFRDMINPIAEALDLDPKTNVLANTILYDTNGNYQGFDRTEHTSRDMGKPAALTYLMEQYGYRTVVMVGDGATDAQAKPPAMAFVGYGGVTVRDAVREKACWYLKSFEPMIQLLKRFGGGGKQ